MRRAGTIVLCLWAAVAFFGGTALADGIPPVTVGCDGTSLSSYLRGGTNSGGCLVGGYFALSNVTFNSDSTSFTNQEIVDALTLNPTWNGRILTLDLQGFGPFDPALDETIQYFFGFTIDPGPIVDTEDITLDPNGSISFFQGWNACEFFTVDGCINSAEGTVGFALPTLTGHVQFPTPESLVNTSNTITVGPGNVPPPDNSHFEGVTFDFRTTSAVPEPSSWALVGTMVALLVPLARRRRR